MQLLFRQRSLLLLSKLQLFVKAYGSRGEEAVFLLSLSHCSLGTLLLIFLIIEIRSHMVVLASLELTI